MQPPATWWIHKPSLAITYVVLTGPCDASNLAERAKGNPIEDGVAIVSKDRNSCHW